MNTLFKTMPADPAHGYSDPDYWVWGSSVIRGDDGRYHMYVSRWTRRKPFFVTWATDSEIAHCVADRPEGPYTFSDIALGKRSPEYWDGQSCHNPKILRHEGKYILYYMGSTHPLPPYPDGADGDGKCPHMRIARANKRIGVAIADRPEGPWQRLDAPVLPTRPGTYYSYLTTNPAPVIRDDGSVLMVFKARRYEGYDPGPFTLGTATAPHYSQPFDWVSDKPFVGEGGYDVEDPQLWKTDTGYTLIAKDFSGRLGGEPGAGFHLHSKNGLDWDFTQAQTAYSCKITWADGTSEPLSHMERAFALVEQGKVTHLFFAAMHGGGHGAFGGTSSWNQAIAVQ